MTLVENRCQDGMLDLQWKCRAILPTLTGFWRSKDSSIIEVKNRGLIHANVPFSIPKEPISLNLHVNE